MVWSDFSPAHSRFSLRNDKSFRGSARPLREHKKEARKFRRLSYCSTKLILNLMRDEKSFLTRNETAGIPEVFQGRVTQYEAINRPQIIHD